MGDTIYTMHSNALRIDVNDTTATIYTYKSVEVLPVDVKLPMCGELVSVTVKDGRVEGYHSRPQAGPFLMVVAVLCALMAMVAKGKGWGVASAIILVVGLVLTLLSM